MDIIGPSEGLGAGSIPAGRTNGFSTLIRMAGKPPLSERISRPQAHLWNARQLGQFVSNLVDFPLGVLLAYRLRQQRAARAAGDLGSAEGHAQIEYKSPDVEPALCPYPMPK